VCIKAQIANHIAFGKQVATLAMNIAEQAHQPHLAETIAKVCGQQIATAEATALANLLPKPTKKPARRSTK
jgi:hypothetical protein